MAPLYLHNNQIETLFELLGNNENDMTKSLGWTLANSTRLRAEFAKQLKLVQGFSENIQIRLQYRSNQSGVTDIEVIDFENHHHVIIEAKRGFSVPSREQLELYAQRMKENIGSATRNLMVVLAESDHQELWLSLQIPKSVCGIPVIGNSWRQFQEMAKLGLSDAHYAEKRLLTQFIEYLRKVTVMQNQYSNQVYVVPLSNSKSAIEKIGNAMTSVDVVKKYKQYFHPVGNHYPNEPPNYIAFRYDGMLQSIHHVKHYLVVEETIPTNDPKGKYKSVYGPGRNWCFIDLLLSCGSVAEAVVKSKLRSEQD